MEFLYRFQVFAIALVPTLATFFLVALVLVAASRVLERKRIRTGEPRVMSQFLLVVLGIFGLLAIILALPVSDTARGHLYTLLGVFISASIALSSSTIVGSAMAGVLIRFISGSRVRPGDYIRAENHVGRVVEMDILHTLIQTATRDVTWLPNLWLVGRPVLLRQKTGTIINATVSIGYDVNRGTVKTALLRAAGQVGLSKPFVRIEDLGDFAVSYKVGGLSTDLTRLLEMHSQLRGAVLDSLHDACVEVASPVIKTSRVFPADHSFIPESDTPAVAQEVSAEDEVMFEEAAEAAVSYDRREVLRSEYEAALSRRDATINPVERRRLSEEIERLVKELAALDQ